MGFFSLKLFYVIFSCKRFFIISSHITSNKIIIKFENTSSIHQISTSWKLFLKMRIWYRYKNKIEKHYHYNVEQQLSFYKKVHIRRYRLSKKKDILIMLSFYFLRRVKMYCKNWRIRICLFGKSRTEDIVKCHILHEESYLRWIVIGQVKSK